MPNDTTVATTDLPRDIRPGTYRIVLSLSRQSAANPGTASTDIALYGLRWSPGAVVTWLVPVSLLALGGAAAYLVRRQLRALHLRDDDAAATPAVAAQRQAA